MPPNPHLAAALEELRVLQATGARVFASSELKRSTRTLLVKHGFLQEVMKGWLISSSTGTRAGDTTPWFASFWEFCRRYCDARFDAAWHVSPEQSLLLHAENAAVPRQVVIYSPRANNDRIDLPHRTSLFALKVEAMLSPGELAERAGVRVFTVEAALVNALPSFFADHPVDARVVLGAIRDPAPLVAQLLEGRQPIVGGRLVGALRHIGNVAAADEMAAALKSADIDIRVSDPFDDSAEAPAAGSARAAARAGFRPASPIVARLRELWKRSRDAAAAHAPEKPARKPARATYAKHVDDIYTQDAYHSLSIEGYQVTPDLIERVATGSWSPGTSDRDRQDANALAARGYWQAFQHVRDSAIAILQTGDVTTIRRSYREWYRELFSPHVAAGLLAARLLAGHRTGPVYLRGSRHVPPRAEIVGEAMATLFDLVEAEPDPFVRAVLGHWLIGYVHPFPDGNGRIARFVMNALLAAGRYPWTVIRVDDRSTYLSALESASVEGDVTPFAAFVARQVQRSSTQPRARTRRTKT